MTCSADDGHEGAFELYKIRTLNKREKNTGSQVNRNCI